MYRKRFITRRSNRRYENLCREWDAEQAVRDWYPKADPKTCKHSTSFCPFMRDGNMMRVCEDCGVEVDMSHKVIGKGVSRDA